MTPPFYIGCAGWSLPRTAAAGFHAEGSHLARYSARLPVVEITSSFYRAHRESTYARWAETVPEHFRFAVKMPRTITHEQRLQQIETPLRSFLRETNALGERLGVLLVQLPPGLPFDPAVARDFLATLRADFDGPVACEPRHPSWFGDEPDALLRELRVARVAADPAPVPAAANPGGWTGLTYYRLHGSPKMYYSDYPPPVLAGIAERLNAAAAGGPHLVHFRQHGGRFRHLQRAFPARAVRRAQSVNYRACVCGRAGKLCSTQRPHPRLL